MAEIMGSAGFVNHLWNFIRVVHMGWVFNDILTSSRGNLKAILVASDIIIDFGSISSGA